MQGNCDPDKPDEHLLWALTQVPITTHQPMIIQQNIARAISTHLWNCGFRHNPELQTRKLLPPFRGQQHALNGSARWVKMDEPEPDPVVLPDMTALTPHEQELVIQQLKEMGRIEDPPERKSVARVTSLRELEAGGDDG
jgi:hypothetical protein